METIVTIIGFVLFSVLMDAFESRKKKKKRNVPVPEPQADAPQKTRGKKRAQRQPAAQPPLPPRTRPQTQAQAPLRSAAPPAAAAIAPPLGGLPESAAGRHFPDPAQLYSNALLDAVAYAEILQSPKAYQYMATRSCTGRWPGNGR